jgi:hypothetical protein
MSAKTFELKSLNSPEEVRKFDKGKVELVNVAGAAIGRATFEPGWKWSTCVKPIAKTNTCQAAHYGYQLSGTLTTRMDDGTERTSKAGDVLNIPPGHDAWVVGNDRWCSSTSRAWSITQDRANRTYYRSFDPLPAGLSCRALLQRMNLVSPAAHRARGAVPEPYPYWHQQTWAGARNPRVSAKRASGYL